MWSRYFIPSLFWCKKYKEFILAYLGLSTGVAALSSLALSGVFFTRYPLNVLCAPTYRKGVTSMVKVLAIDVLIHLAATTTYHGAIHLFDRTKVISSIPMKQLITGALLGGFLATTSRVVLFCFCFFFVMNACGHIAGEALDAYLNITFFLIFKKTPTRKEADHPIWTLAKLIGKIFVVVSATPFVFFATSKFAINYKAPLPSLPSNCRYMWVGP